MRQDRIPIDEDSFLRVKNPELMQRVANDMLIGWHARAMLGKQRDLKIAETAAKIEHIASNLCTEDFIATGPESYWYWVQREGHHFWADKTNRKQYLRDNPHARRKVVTGRTLITAATPWGDGKPKITPKAEAHRPATIQPRAGAANGPRIIIAKS